VLITLRLITFPVEGTDVDPVDPVNPFDEVDPVDDV